MKKKILYIIIIVLILVLFFHFFYKKNKKVNISMPNDEFIINKLHYYSTANAISNTTNYQNPEWNLKVYQYTDVAIYFDRLNQKVTEENYIMNLELFDIEVSSSENKEVYYMNPLMFGKNELYLNSLIEDNLKYSVINSTNSENEQNYNIPIYFQDCSNPITLRIVNYLSNNYKVSKDNSLVYNGSLIRELGFNPKDLDTNLSFNLKIITKDGKTRIKKVDFDIIFENENKSILDGDIEIEVNEDIRL